MHGNDANFLRHHPFSLTKDVVFFHENFMSRCADLFAESHVGFALSQSCNAILAVEYREGLDRMKFASDRLWKLTGNFR